jgi:hypothetical protein
VPCYRKQGLASAYRLRLLPHCGIRVAHSPNCKAARPLTTFRGVEPIFLALGVINEGNHLARQGQDKPAPLARSALGPCHNGPARAWEVTSGRPRFGGTAGRGPFGSRSWHNADTRFRLWSRRSGVRVSSVTLRPPEQHAAVMQPRSRSGSLSHRGRNQRPGRGQPSSRVMLPGLAPRR